MIFLDFRLQFDDGEEDVKTATKNESTGLLEIDENSDDDIQSSLNKHLGERCAFDDNLSAYVYKFHRHNLSVACAFPPGKVTIKDCKHFLKKYLLRELDVFDITIKKASEITASQYASCVAKTFPQRFSSRRAVREIGLDYFDNFQFDCEELVAKKGKKLYDDAIGAASSLLPDPSLISELKRIYSPRNKKRFYGHPVHYKVSASNSDSAKQLIAQLVSSLWRNGRLQSRRVNYVCHIKDGCYEEDDLRNLFKYSEGSTIVLELAAPDSENQNLASVYEEVIAFIGSLIKKYCQKVLFIFVELHNHNGFGNGLVAAVQEDIDIVEIHEGAGNRDQALNYLKRLSTDCFGTDLELRTDDLLPKKKKEVYSVSELYRAFDEWSKTVLKNDIYKAYRTNENRLRLDEENQGNNAYKKLQKMVGLSEIKQVVDQIIGTYRINALRQNAGLNNDKTAMHMVFKGNPGSAKTTVARLLAEILTKEGILSSGQFVECGRSDLVGKYVGWTANKVKTKFREAKGGILFIDEAYSLVEEHRSFGDEAINTIVQEMENNRFDVIVIFAGYPSKMDEFVERNEGLKSRIAFHLHFPDYQTDELIAILNLLAAEREYKLHKGTYAVCRRIFDAAHNQKDFGNGRFARNLLEQAILKQSGRLMKKYKGKTIPKKALQTLVADDFDVNIASLYHETKTIGF